MVILAECHADTLLSRMLLVPAFDLDNADIDRSCNIGAVSSRFSKYYQNRKAVGIIDFDRNMGATFKSFKIYKKNNLQNMDHRWNEQTHHLIYFKNGLEHFINESADQSGIDRNRFPKFKTVNQIKAVTKSIEVENNGEFRNFLAAIKNAKPDNFKTFISWVDTIRELK